MVVVEGRSDTARLAEAVHCDTIETRGSALGPAVLTAIRLAVRTRGAIVLTDPDFNGNRLRSLITAACPGVVQASISQAAGRATHDNPHQTLGIEHAQPAVLAACLQAADAKVGQTVGPSDIDRSFLLDQGLLAGPAASAKRALVGQQLQIGYGNGKQFYYRLRAYGYRQADVRRVLEGRHDGGKN